MNLNSIRLLNVRTIQRDEYFFIFLRLVART
jgi:hypothetical protein